MSTPGIDWLRKKYPMYADKSDSDLVSAFKGKFYPDKPDDEFLTALEKKGSDEQPLLSKIGHVAAALPAMLPAIGKRLAQTPIFLGGLGDPAHAPGNLAIEWAKDPEGTRRKMVDATLDLALLPLGGPMSETLAKVPLMGSALMRGVVEGAGIGSIYEGIDATVAGESAHEVARRAWEGAKFGAAGGALIGGMAGAAGATIRRLAAKAGAEVDVAARGTAQAPPEGQAPGLASALEDSGIRHEPWKQLGPGQPQGLLPERSSIPPLNELPSSGRTIITPEPGTGGTPEVPQGINVLPHGTETRYDVPRIWGSDRMLPERSSIPPVTEVPSSGAPIQLPATGVQRLQNAFPKVEWNIQPTGIRSTNASRAFPLGSTVFDVSGRPLTVLAYTDDGALGVESALRHETGRVGKVGFADVTPGPPTPLVTLLNRLELGARTRMALRQHESTTLHASTGIDLVAKAAGSTADEVAIGLGKLGRVYEYAKQLGWTPSERFQEWSRAMIAEFGQEVAPRLKDVYRETNKQYGDALRTTLTRDPRTEEALHDAVQRLRTGGFTGKEWYDVREKLTALMGKELTDKFIPLLAIFSPRNSVTGNVTKALDALVEMETGATTEKGRLPAHQMNFDRWRANEPLSGTKVNNFNSNLGGNLNPVTLDMWMSYFLRGEKAFHRGLQDFSPREYELGQAVVRDFAKEHGLAPAQMQATMWTDEVVQREILGKMVAEGVAHPTNDVTTLRDFGDVTAQMLPERTALQQTIQNGGGTWYYGRPTKVMDRPGFVVALVEKGAPIGEVSPRTLTEMRERTAPLVKKFGGEYTFTTGTWHDDTGRKLWVGTGVIVPTLEEALAIGRSARQFSVAELGQNGEFVTTHETGVKTPGTLTVREARQVLSRTRQEAIPLAGN